MKEIPIVFADDYLIIIDKPAGITVTKSENEKGETIQDWVEKKLGIKKEELRIKNKSDFYQRAGVVHRLDKETSGLLMIAKNEEYYFKLQQQFLRREVEKTYTALVHGRIETASLIIKNKVGRLPWNRRKFGVIEEGREAVTEIIRLKVYQEPDGNSYSLIDVLPKTGRTHQIRIHLKHINHPIVSDNLYAGRKVYRQDLKSCPRIFLHARKIVFDNPEGGRKMTFESDLPEDLVKVLNLFTPVG